MKEAVKKNQIRWCWKEKNNKKILNEEGRRERKTNLEKDLKGKEKSIKWNRKGKIRNVINS